MWTTYEIEGIGIDTIWGYFLYSYYGLPNSDSPCLTILPTQEVLSPPKLQLFPNPTNNWLQIQADDTLEFVKYKIHDVHGKLIHSDFFSNTIEIDSLTTGVYVLVLYDKLGKIFSESFVKI